MKKKIKRKRKDINIDFLLKIQATDPTSFKIDPNITYPDPVPMPPPPLPPISPPNIPGFIMPPPPNQMYMEPGTVWVEVKLLIGESYGDVDGRLAQSCALNGTFYDEGRGQIDSSEACGGVGLFTPADPIEVSLGFYPKNQLSSLPQQPSSTEWTGYLRWRELIQLEDNYNQGTLPYYIEKVKLTQESEKIPYPTEWSEFWFYIDKLTVYTYILGQEVTI